MTHQRKVLKEQFRFYSELYKSRIDELLPTPQYLDNLELPSLTEDEHLMLDEPLVIEEVAEAIKSLKNNKAAGCDGLKIYKRYSYLPVPTLLALYKEVLDKKQLHISARTGLITLIEKVGRNPCYLKDWRPLTLLNCDYKILAKILATRLNIVLPKLIHPMQSGFMKGRSIHENIVKLINLADQWRIQDFP